MFRALVIAFAIVVVACGGTASTDNTIGTIGSTTTSRVSTTTTTLAPEPVDLQELVIAIDRMPTGWVQVDDMSGPIGLDDIDAALIEGLGDPGIVDAYRRTFARSATSEVGALARAGAELIISIAVEMEDAEAAAVGVETIADNLDPMTINSITIRTPGEGVRVELTGGIFTSAWTVDNVIQIVIANGAPGANLVNIIDIVPDGR